VSEPEIPPPAAADRAEPAPQRRARRRPLPAAEWAAWDDERLLGLRFRDLDLPLGGELEQRIGQLEAELAARGLAFRPHFWLSDEWFTPDGVPGVAIPFYLAHPRLARLELHQMLEVEGGSLEWCMKILRHEAGHAIENAYHLRRRRQRRELFGSTASRTRSSTHRAPTARASSSTSTAGTRRRIPTRTSPRRSRSGSRPSPNWRERYADWPALRKLEYVDELMRELAGKPPPVTVVREVDPLPSLRQTLRRHYEIKREHYGVNRPEFYDRDLRRLFSDSPEHARHPTAASFLTRIRREMRQLCGRWTNEYQYTIDRVLGDMIARSRELNLRLATPPEQAKLDFAVLLTVQTMNYLHSGRHRVAL
jgi:hypothetical protein